MKLCVPSQERFLIHKAKVNWFQIVLCLVTKYSQLAGQLGLAGP